MNTIFDALVSIAERLPRTVRSFATGGGEFFLSDADQLPLYESDTFANGADHRADLDNLTKAVLDAANKIVWFDDCWVDYITADRALPPTGGEHVAHLIVWRLVDETP